MYDFAEEEREIIVERNRKSKVLNKETFKNSISLLCHGPIKTLPHSATLGDAIDTMQKEKIGALPIVKENKLVGIITERDILMKVIGKIENYREKSVSEAMTPDPKKLRKKDPIARLMNMMDTGGFRHVPVVDDDGKPLHMISIKDVMAYILSFFPEEILNGADSEKDS